MPRVLTWQIKASRHSYEECTTVPLAGSGFPSLLPPPRLSAFDLPRSTAMEY